MTASAKAPTSHKFVVPNSFVSRSTKVPWIVPKSNANTVTKRRMLIRIYKDKSTLPVFRFQSKRFNSLIAKRFRV